MRLTKSMIKFVSNYVQTRYKTNTQEERNGPILLNSFNWNIFNTLTQHIYKRNEPGMMAIFFKRSENINNVCRYTLWTEWFFNCFLYTCKDMRLNGSA